MLIPVGAPLLIIPRRRLRPFLGGETLIMPPPPPPPPLPPPPLTHFPQDDDIDDIMSTFGPVSIRTGQEDILFCPKDEAPLPMFDRIIGKAPDASARPEGKGAGGGTGRGGVVRIGSGKGAEGSRDHGNGSGGRSRGGGGGGFGGGARITGGIRGNGAARAAAAAAAGQAAEASASAAAALAALAYKKPSVPPPAYSSLPRPREAPLAVPPPLAGGGGRPTAPARHSSARLARRGEDTFGFSDELSGRRALSGGSTAHGRNRAARYGNRRGGGGASRGGKH